MLKRYDAGLSIFSDVIDSKLTTWAKKARQSIIDEIVPKLTETQTFLSIDEVSIPGYRIGVVGICKSPMGNVNDCEFSITFENLTDKSNLVIEMSTTKGYADQSGFSDKLDIFNTDKWLRFITGTLQSYVPTALNTISKSGTATIKKTK